MADMRDDHDTGRQTDIVSLITQEHETLKGGLAGGSAVTAAEGAERDRSFREVPDTPPGNMLAGPVAALFDRMRDAARHV